MLAVSLLAVWRHISGLSIYFFNVGLFIYFERERVGEEQRERERDRGSKQAPRCQPKPTVGLELTNLEIMT